MSITEVSSNVECIKLNTNSYLIEKRILIDTGMEFEKERYIEEMIQLTDPKNIQKVIFTHLHYDHIELANIFPNAKFYSKKTDTEELLQYTLRHNKINIKINDIFKQTNLNEIFQIFSTPGHSKDSICVYYEKDNILFTGDTYFSNSIFGRTDLPTSDANEMKVSIKKIKSFIKEKNPIICPGHGQIGKIFLYR